MTTILDPAQAALLADERDALQRLLDVLAGWDTSTDDVRRLQDALDGLHQLFLLVVAGEFNSGKSALINALLGEPLLEEGVTPTTEQVQVLTYGETKPPQRVNDHWMRALSAPILSEMHIVDTPGTNAILRQHEALTRQFVPRADLAVFVTSADRPFTESERAFMAMIRDWGKKIVLVVNKIDLLESAAERGEVEAFVRRGASELLGTAPPFFAVSAREARRAMAADDSTRLAASGWPAFAAWLKSTLTAEGRVRLKLLSPLGVAERLATVYRAQAAAQQSVLEADRGALDDVAQEVAQRREAMRLEFAGRLDGIDVLIMSLRERGEAFLDTYVRLTRIRDLMAADRLRQHFESEVVADTPAVVEAEVSALIDWLVDREHEQWQAVQQRLADRAQARSLIDRTAPGRPGFGARRQALLERIGQRSDAVVARFDPAAESARLTLGVQDALAKTALVEVGAVGLGIVLKAAFISTAADATGLLAAGVLAIFGLTLLPHRRRQAAATLRRRTAEVRDELRRTLSQAFERELASSSQLITAATAPYDEFLLDELERLQTAVQALDALSADFTALNSRIVAATGGGES